MKQKWIFLLLMGILFTGKTLTAQNFVVDEKESFRWKLIGRAFFDAGIISRDSVATSFQIDDLRLGAYLHFFKALDRENRMDVL